MASSTTTGHDHEYLSDDMGAACIFCGAPHPLLYEKNPLFNGEMARAIERIGTVPDPRRFLTGSDPGDEG